jgi:hypothetical protein
MASARQTTGAAANFVAHFPKLSDRQLVYCSGEFWPSRRTARASDLQNVELKKA